MGLNILDNSGGYTTPVNARTLKVGDIAKVVGVVDDVNAYMSAYSHYILKTSTGAVIFGVGDKVAYHVPFNLLHLYEVVVQPTGFKLTLEVK